MDYDKQPINVEEQVALLQNRGLVIEDITTAKLQLLNISYFRRTRQTLWGGSADANPKLLPNDT